MITLDGAQYKTRGYSTKVLNLGVEVLLTHSQSDDIGERLRSYTICDPFFEHRVTLNVLSKDEKDTLLALDGIVSYTDSFGATEDVVITSRPRVERNRVERYIVNVEMRSA